MWDYSEKVMEHFLHPRNVGEIENPDAVGVVGNMTCGDALKLALRIDKTTNRIVDAKFQTFGCASAIASSSALTEVIKGMTVDEAAKITNDDIQKYLGGLPEEKMHCSVMGRDALEVALTDYRGEHTREAVPEGKLICACFGVTEEQIVRVIRENDLKTVEDVTHYSKAGGGCGGCHKQIERIIAEVQAEMGKGEPPSKPQKPARLTNIKKMQLVQETLDKEIRPALQKDGGDIELIDIVDNRVLVALRGHCAGCLAAPITLKSFVEVKLHEYVSDDLITEVVEE